MYLLAAAVLMGLSVQPSLLRVQALASSHASPSVVASGGTVLACRYGEERINPQTGRKQTCR
jgi:hypothetical protein